MRQVLVSILTATVLSVSVVAPAEEANTVKVLMLGDSHTKYGMPEAAQGPLNELTRGKVAWTLINAGIGGEAAEKGKERLAALLDQHRPDVLTVQYSGNDLGKRYTPEQFHEHMLGIVQIARKHASAPKTLLLTSPVVDANRHSFGKNAQMNAQGGADWVLETSLHAVTRRLAAEEGLPLIDLHRYHAGLANWADLIVADGVHLSKGGYKVIGGYVAECVAAWYAAEMAKDPKAVKSRDEAADKVKALSEQFDEIKNGAGNTAQDRPARKELLARLDEVWRACPYLPAGGAAWHEVRYRNATTQPRTMPVATPAAPPTTSRPATAPTQPTTQGTTKPTRTDLQPFSEQETQEIQKYLQKQYGAKLQELATKQNAVGLTEVPIYLELDARGQVRRVRVDLPGEDHAKFKARVELDIIASWTVPNPPRAGSCTVRLPIAKPPPKTPIFEVAPRD
jgi:lysophospholipase L1-like esterase